MNNDYWLARWRDEQTGWHQAEVNAHLQEFWGRIHCAAEARVFVPLCGKSRDMLWLRGQGHPVLGVEVSELAVEAFFTDHGLDAVCHQDGDFQRCSCDHVELLQGDFFHLTAERLHGVGAVYDRASLVALPPQLRERYAEHLQRIVPARSHILLVSMEYDQSRKEGPPFSVGEEEVRGHYEARYRVEKLFEKEIIDENPRYRGFGIDSMLEVVYHLTPR
ncbi:thiopurine S-methyltransferase [Endothiovibrio diazotrophicus]